MSITAGTWAAIFLSLLVLSLRRPAYAVALYLLTFFAAPHLWWWREDLPDLRYAVIAGVALLGAVLFCRVRSTEVGGHRFTSVHIAAIAMAVNATFVHFAISSTPSVSIDNYVEFLKFVLLFFLMWRAIQDRRDLRLVIMAIALGAAYIGYEVTINERGDFNGSRLEGVGAPGADQSNSLASVMLLALPIIGSLFVYGKIRDKLTAVLAAPLVLNVVLLCNSRGAFLALIGAGFSFLLVARGAARKQALKALALGGVVLFLLLGDPDIFNRFMTTFAGSEERDRSAASRLDFWHAGLLMVADYPLGDGGGSFKYVHGGTYLTRALGHDAPERSLHNGYLTEATEWGLQGLLFRLIFIGAAVTAAFRTSNRCRLEGRPKDALMGNCLIVALAGFLIGSLFGSFLRNEWGYWIVALLVRYGEMYRVPEPVLAPTEAGRTHPVGGLSRASAAMG
jgi:putative inorganic carbon (HCO3(-)) transporter